MLLSRLHRRPRRAAYIVEFAVVAPVFFLFIFALIDIGRGMMATSILNSAARAGCRTAVLPGKANSDVQTAVSQALSGLGVSGTNTIIQVNGKTQDVSKAQAQDVVTVSVTAPVSSVTWLPVTWFVNGNLRGQFSLQHE